MVDINLYKDYLTQRIQAFAPGQEFSLVELFGGEWKEDWSADEGAVKTFLAVADGIVLFGECR